MENATAREGLERGKMAAAMVKGTAAESSPRARYHRGSTGPEQRQQPQPYRHHRKRREPPRSKRPEQLPVQQPALERARPEEEEKRRLAVERAGEEQHAELLDSKSGGSQHPH